MNLQLIKNRYNAVGYHEMIDYRNKEYNEELENIRPFLKNLIKYSKKAIDLGCNGGKYSFFMEELGAEVTGIDFSSGALEIARKIKEDIKSKCNFIEGNILDMSFEKNSFDLALFPLNIVELQYNDMEILCKKLKNILSPNGIFCITMQDGIKRIETKRDSKNSYDFSTGIHKEFHNIPHKGMYEYEIYFWTVAFAKHIIGKYFSLVKEIEYKDNRYWLEFKNEK